MLVRRVWPVQCVSRRVPAPGLHRVRHDLHAPVSDDIHPFFKRQLRLHLGLFGHFTHGPAGVRLVDFAGLLRQFPLAQLGLSSSIQGAAVVLFP